MDIIKIKDASKVYRLYEKPIDRIKEAFSISGKNYHRNHYALKNINLTIKSGEITGFVGKNGAGKSTLLKIITGVTELTEGTVSVDGRITALLELGTAFNPEYTGIQNIFLYGTMMGLSRTTMESKLQEIIDFADIGEFIHNQVKTYSSGMFSRLAFAVAINVEPDILIADEILSVGDTAFQNKCIQKMKSLMEMGKTVLFVSHDLHSIKYFCDRIIWLDNGSIIEDGYDIVGILDRYERNILPNRSNRKTEVMQSSVSDLVKIHNTYFVNREGEKVSRFTVGEQFDIIIEYEILGEIDDCFFGIGMKNSQTVYVNGLNTKLDGFKPDITLGKHVLKLSYSGFNLYKDIYTVWSVCYNPSGTVVLSDYIMKDAIEIVSDRELCEGITNIEHRWSKIK
ncbi:ABC transporter ATP-binding protein [Clostridium saccharobutylicum]|uniref:Teichoic acids export ATP-binding protein TagH n=1 Tax=Clostridium saccharobutylicum TaxID=169679 RepID=A0A1S8NJ54_CLOSA|nr:ABC transporter ATP-binding protein [Clostridium saccharobutylicum]OOM16515.1 teichoic acids export ATP-binding protein TagH [Clostridium saccharobutylicum]